MLDANEFFEIPSTALVVLHSVFNPPNSPRIEDAGVEPTTAAAFLWSETRFIPPLCAPRSSPRLAPTSRSLAFRWEERSRSCAEETTPHWEGR